MQPYVRFFCCCFCVYFPWQHIFKIAESFIDSWSSEIDFITTACFTDCFVLILLKVLLFELNFISLKVLLNMQLFLVLRLAHKQCLTIHNG